MHLEHVFRLSWQMTQSSFILHDAGGIVCALGGTPDVRVCGAVYVRVLVLEELFMLWKISWTSDMGAPWAPVAADAFKIGVDGATDGVFRGDSPEDAAAPAGGNVLLVRKGALR